MSGRFPFARVVAIVLQRSAGPAPRLPMDERIECSISGCLKPPAALLGSQFFCRGHFVITCYTRLDFCAELLRTRTFTGRMSEEMRKFVGECTQQAARLSETANNLNNIERARLLDILFYASDLGSHMRRSPRKPLAIPVRVICKTPGRPWQEDSLTRAVSRFGGMLECQQTIKPDDVLVLEHIESGRSVNAHMVWGWRAKSGSFVTGLEFVDCSNFWELDWSDPPANSVPSEPAGVEQSAPKVSA